MNRSALTFCMLSFAVSIVLGVGGCSIPSLESPTCSQARDAVKSFYSFHFGNDMSPTAENLKQREKFLTPEFFRSVSATGDGKTDIFTASADYPRTFKVGKCEERGPDKAELQVQVYWRSDEQTVQREVKVEAVRNGDTWLINNVSNQ